MLSRSNALCSAAIFPIEKQSRVIVVRSFKPTPADQYNQVE